jgi:hypothetical protein
MKSALSIILIFIFSCNSNGNFKEPNKYDSSISGDSIKKSTSYLARRDSIINETELGSIYITSDTSSKIYRWLSPNIENDEESYYDEYFEHIKKIYSVEVKKHSFGSLNRKWTSLFLFNKKFYLWSPSDYMANEGRIINDSSLITAKSDGDISIILDYKFINSQHQLKTIDYQGTIKIIEISPIRSELGIYLWTYKSLVGKIIDRQLMVESQNIKLFPVLVFDCGKVKCVFDKEIEYFDPIDSL